MEKKNKSSTYDGDIKMVKEISDISIKIGEEILIQSEKIRSLEVNTNELKNIIKDIRYYINYIKIMFIILVIFTFVFSFLFFHSRLGTNLFH